jgi:hypothetical protein
MAASGTDRVVDANDGDIQLDRFASNNSVEIIDGGDSESKIVGDGGNNSLDFRNATFENISEVDAGAGNDTVRGTRDDDVDRRRPRQRQALWRRRRRPTRRRSTATTSSMAGRATTR